MRLALVIAFCLVASVAHTAPLPGALLYKQRCALCHPSDGTSARGPGLGGVVGRKAAAMQFAYTAALRDSKLTWTRAMLDRFLAQPDALVPGTNMPLPTPDASDRAALITYLATLRASVAPKPTAKAAPSAAGDWHDDAPGKVHRIVLDALPAPFASTSSRNPPQVVARPADRMPLVPAGFTVELYAEKIAGRVLRTAPNGDVFVAETRTGTIHVLRGATRPQHEVFATGLDGPFGIAFFPAGPQPRFVYVAQENSVVRFPYANGDLHARAAAEPIVKQLAPTSGGHTTRDLVFSADGTRMLVSVGSSSNVAEAMSAEPPGGIATWEQLHGIGASWDDEAWRADVISFAPDGTDRRPFATGLRNCVGLALSPVTHEPWCATNERDSLGDDLVPDYVTRVKAGAYYGWPFYWLGAHAETRVKAKRTDLARKATVPDVLLQAHSAALGIAFYDKQTFPAKYRNSAFVALHGSWNRSRRTGYKVVRIPMDERGGATGSYEDFMTGFVVDDDHVWGRPVGITVAADGALLVVEDGNDRIWRVSR